MSRLRRLKFSIEDLMLVTLLAALCTGWWLDHRRMVARVEEYPTQVAEKKVELIRVKAELLRQGAPPFKLL
ncbi:MAG TPA: hypothetical protein VFE46_02915 [Pirellulales bacterium]|jgi:hypothetical protein|nr:hypothetical protein [Pirellulales bacterium]